MTPVARHRSPSASGHGERAVPLLCERLGHLRDAGRDAGVRADQVEDGLHGTLCDPELGALRSPGRVPRPACGSGRTTRVPGSCSGAARSSSIPSRMARSIGSPPPGSVVSAACNRTPSRSSSSPRTTTSATASSFFVMVPVLSAQRMSTPAISSTAGRWLTRASRLARSRAPTAMVTDSTAGQRHRDGCDRHHERELERGRHAGTAQERDDHDDGDQDEGDRDQVLSDREDRPLEVAGWRLHPGQLGRPPEQRSRSRGQDAGDGPAARDDRP